MRSSSAPVPATRPNPRPKLVPGALVPSLVAKDHVHTVKGCPYLTTTEAARYTGFSTRTMRLYFEQQRTSGLPAVRFSVKNWKIRSCELEAWMVDRAERVLRGELV